MVSGRLLVGLVAVWGTGCGFSAGGAGAGDGDGGTPGSETTVPLPDANPDLAPSFIPGGGVKDAPIGGVLHVHVIDEISNARIGNATVVVAGVTMMTDAMGLATFKSAAVVGKQSILVTRASYRSAFWVGVNGANVTVPLASAGASSVPQAQLSGVVSGWTGLPNNGPDHSRAGYISYSTLDSLSAAENGLNAFDFNFGGPPSNTCYGDVSCPYALSARTGKVALFATIFDYDDNGTNNSTADDVLTFMAFAEKRDVEVTAGIPQTQNLTPLPAGDVGALQVSFGTPSLAFKIAKVAVELGAEGVVTLENSITANGAVAVPQRSHFAPTVATYRVTARAYAEATTQSGATRYGGSTSAVVMRGISSNAAVEVTGWIGVPGSPVVTHSMASWAPIAAAKLGTVELFSRAAGGGPSGSVTRILQVIVFDGAGSVAWPTGVTIPPGMFYALIGATGGTFDPSSFAFDADAGTFDTFSSTDTIQVN